VQPTAVARRKVFLGGRRLQQTGRPPKSMFREHSYSLTKRRLELNQAVLPARKKSMLHSISYCVQQNESLGRTHSKK